MTSERTASVVSDLTSPVAGFVTYSLDDCLTMLVVHEQRHMLQAKRVMASERVKR